MKPYYVPPVYYLPLGHAISLINRGASKEKAMRVTLSRFARFGRGKRKHINKLKPTQFAKHLERFLNTEDAILVRKGISKNQYFRK